MISEKILQKTFYQRDSTEVAKDILSKILVHESSEGITAGRIVEQNHIEDLRIRLQTVQVDDVQLEMKLCLKKKDMPMSILFMAYIFALT